VVHRARRDDGPCGARTPNSGARAVTEPPRWWGADLAHRREILRTRQSDVREGCRGSDVVTEVFSRDGVRDPRGAVTGVSRGIAGGWRVGRRSEVEDAGNESPRARGCGTERPSMALRECGGSSSTVGTRVRCDAPQDVSEGSTRNRDVRDTGEERVACAAARRDDAARNRRLAVGASRGNGAARPVRMLAMPRRAMRRRPSTWSA